MDRHIQNVIVNVNGGDGPRRRKGGGCGTFFLELFFGVFQIFGIGHMAAGSVGFGLFVMLSYWIVCSILILSVVGIAAWPFVFVGYLIFSPLLAASH